MPERMDEHDLVTNADVWNKFNYAKGQFELWKDHVSRKYRISANNHYTSSGEILRTIDSMPQQTVNNPDTVPGTLKIPPAFTEALKNEPEKPA